MDRHTLKKFVEDNPHLVTAKRDSNFPGLIILRYKNRVFYDNLWNEFLEECRGTIVDEDFNVVSRPFTKIYNYGIDANSPILDPDTEVEYFRKVNGFMVAVTWHNNSLLVSTTGSLSSDFVNYAYDMIDVTKYEETCRENPTKTFMFECVHKSDPHIIVEEEGMYLLGYREKTWDNSPIEFADLDRFAYLFNCFFMYGRTATVEQVQKFAKAASHEGYVAYSKEGIAFKIKSPFYLVNKFFARASNIEKILSKNVKEKVDEEFYPLVDYVQLHASDFIKLSEQSRLEFVKSFLKDL